MSNASSAASAAGWLVAHASVTGRGHVARGLPCQDNHTWRPLPENPAWGVAIVSDGAGSCAHSELGSARIVAVAGALFTDLLRVQGWATRGQLPTPAAWREAAVSGLRTVADDLHAYASSQQLPFRSLSATVIVLVMGPPGVLVAHVGDGRAAGQQADGQWVALLEPYRGEEANVTVFLTSDIWQPARAIRYIGTSVFTEPFQAVAVLSDGCEMTCFQLSTYDETTQQHQPLNQPHAPFFDPNVAVLRQLHQQGKSQEDINQLWASFLTDGNPRLAAETDDKTLLLAVRLPATPTSQAAQATTSRPGRLVRNFTIKLRKLVPGRPGYRRR